MPDLQSLITEDHHRLRELFRGAVGDPDDHAVLSLVRALTIHERVEEEMLAAVAESAGPEVVRHSRRAREQHLELLDAVLALHSQGQRSAGELIALEQLFLVHLDHEEKVLMPAIVSVAGTSGMVRLGSDYQQTRAEHHRAEGPFRPDVLVRDAALSSP